jgi:hypothetical protein
MKENWKDIEGFEGYYQVSDFGNVRSLDREFIGTTGIRQVVKGKMMSYRSDKDGYNRALLSKNRVQKTIGVHRLVASAFISNPENKPEVDHIDASPQNNHVSNLRWVVSSENKLNPITRKRNSNACINRLKAKHKSKILV